MTDESAAPRPAIASPCVQICVVDPASRLCTGCLRSIDEITQWARYSDEDRAAIMADLPARKPLIARRRGGRAGRLKRRQAASSIK